jgi:protein O-mannosyl-transferase
MNLDSAVEASAPRSGEREQADSASPAEFGMNFVPGWLGNRAAGALIFCLTLLAYLPSLSGDFIWNDSDYVTAPALRSLGGLGRIWTEPGATQQYYPLLHSAFWVQHRLWGDRPLGYHIVTLLLHAGSAVLFALVLRRLLGNDSGPSTPLRAFDSGSTAAGHERRRYAGAEWLAALLFALHPAHVESVAWITEQKNTLSLAFYLAAALAYLRFDETRQPRTYVAALALFILSMLSKTVTATLPAALLVVLWWKRGRLSWRTDVLPLLPWLAVGAAGGLFSSWVEKHYLVAEGTDFSLPFLGRLLVAGRAVWFYVGTLVWPFNLNFIYPRWTVNVAAWQQWLFPLGVLAFGAGLWAIRRRTRAPLAAFLFFVGSLFPVLGFVNLYGSLYSWVWDHWQYLPDLGLIALAAAGLAQAGDWAETRFRWLGPAMVAALAIGLGALTWEHCGMFRDDQTLYRTTIARNPTCWMAHNNLGNTLNIAEQTTEAISEYEVALRIKPDHAGAHYNLAFTLAGIPGRLPEAIAEYEATLQLKPDYPEAHFNLGLALARSPGRSPEAMAQFEAALRIKPDYPEAYNNLGIALANYPERSTEAIAQFEAALKQKPDYPDAHNNLGMILARIPGRLPEAIVHYEAALQTKPDFAEAHNNLGIALTNSPGRSFEAIAEYEAALRIKPDYSKAHFNLGRVLMGIPGRQQEALTHFEEALRLRPDWVPARQMVEQLRTH